MTTSTATDRDVAAIGRIAAVVRILEGMARSTGTRFAAVATSTSAAGARFASRMPLVTA